MTEPETITPQEIEERFLELGFIATGDVATTLYLSEQLGKPLLLEGLARGVAELVRRL